MVVVVSHTCIFWQTSNSFSSSNVTRLTQLCKARCLAAIVSSHPVSTQFCPIISMCIRNMLILFWNCTYEYTNYAN